MKKLRQEDEIMPDAEQKIDWDAVRRAADDCLNATWSLVCFAEVSQGSEYDANRATAHLEAIDRARDTFRPAMEVLQPGLECATDDAIRYSPVFDALALATAGRSERPDFRYGPVCCATAHEAAFELLRSAILWVENGLNAELDERGLPDQYVAGIDELHKLSPEELRDTLVRLEKRESLQRLLRGRGLRQIRASINHEWAAVNDIAAKSATFGGAKDSLNPDGAQYLDITLGDREATRIVDGEALAVEFGKKEKAWELFRALVEVGNKGIHRRELDGAIGGSLDKHKKTLLDLLEELKLDVDLERGMWTLIPLGS